MWSSVPHQPLEGAGRSPRAQLPGRDDDPEEEHDPPRGPVPVALRCDPLVSRDPTSPPPTPRGATTWARKRTCTVCTRLSAMHDAHEPPTLSLQLPGEGYPSLVRRLSCDDHGERIARHLQRSFAVARSGEEEGGTCHGRSRHTRDPARPTPFRWRRYHHQRHAADANAARHANHQYYLGAPCPGADHRRLGGGGGGAGECICPVAEEVRRRARPQLAATTYRRAPTDPKNTGN